MASTLVETRGFSPDFMRFFKEIAKHNNKEWFTANKERYELVVKEPCLAFIAAAGPGLHQISTSLVADPRPVGGSMFRIYRDTRFSKDKSPYKTHAAMHFSHRDNSDEGGNFPGFYLHMGPGDSGIWAGVWRPAPTLLGKIRDAIVARPADWRKAKAGWTEADHGESLKRVPAGYAPDHPLAADLKRKDFIVGQPVTDAQVTSPDLLDRFLRTCRGMGPFNAFLAKAMRAPW